MIYSDWPQWTYDETRKHMIIGDMDKPFHYPECQCKDCEEWRLRNNKPTYEQLKRKIGQP